MKLRSIVLFSVLTISFTSCINVNDRPKTAYELKAELKQEELKNPIFYLSDKEVTLQLQKKKVKNAGLFSKAKYIDDGAVIEGIIENKATLAKYKDIVVQITYYTQTETIINKESYTIYQYYEPNSSRSFRIKVYPPTTYKKFGFEVIGATGVID